MPIGNRRRGGRRTRSSLSCTTVSGLRSCAAWMERTARRHDPDSHVAPKRLRSALSSGVTAFPPRYCQPWWHSRVRRGRAFYTRHISRILCDYILPAPLSSPTKECEAGNGEVLVIFGMLVIDSSRDWHQNRASGRANASDHAYTYISLSPCGAAWMFGECFEHYLDFEIRYFSKNTDDHFIH